MTLREAMLQAASPARVALGEATHLIVAFLRSQVSPDGGFRGRSPDSDLYFTVFGAEALLALGADLPRDALDPYLRGFGTGDGLDFVHLAGLARCWADLGGSPGEETRRRIAHRIGAFRSADGGFNQRAAAARGTAYACFLALGAYQDWGAEVPDVDGLVRCVEGLRTEDGAFSNEPGGRFGATPATAAAVVVLRHLGERVPSSVADWLLARCLGSGGFLAAPRAPMADLLSTATALHALAAMDVSLDEVSEPCLDYLDSLWDSRGGFHGSWADDALDCEYTFYGLLALGHLSPPAGETACGRRGGSL